jgi:hypothetical protein
MHKWIACPALGCLIIVLSFSSCTTRSGKQADIGSGMSVPSFRILERMTEPLLKADRPWEEMAISYASVVRDGRRWRMWYGAYDRNYKRDDDSHFCYAESTDGIRWTKPELNLVEFRGSRKNNILISGPLMGGFCFSSVFMDWKAPDAERYKLIFLRYSQEQGIQWRVCGGVSGDGIHWRLLPEPLSKKNSDTQTICIPEKNRYRLYTRIWRGGWKGVRTVGYTESATFGDFPAPREIFSHDAQDPPGMQFYSSGASKLSDRLYVLLPAAFYTREQIVNGHLAWSRDGTNFTRVGHGPVADVGTGFDSRSLYPLGGAVAGEKKGTWWIYYIANEVKHDQPKSVKTNYEGGIGRFLLEVND